MSAAKKSHDVSSEGTSDGSAVGNFPENIEEASEYLRLSLRALSAAGLAPNPINYSVFYVYHSGNCQSLRDEIDRLNAAGQPLSPDVSDQLFQRYVFNCDESLMEAYRDELLQIVAQTLGSLADFVGETSTTSETLESHASRLAKADTLRDVLGTVAALISDTRHLVKRTSSLEAGLSASLEEIRHLRRELQVAREQALTDLLTGLMNRRAFWDVLQQGIEEASSDGPLKCMLLLDIDHFKSVNDNHGHLAGDKVLRAVSKLLLTAVKGRDKVARIGGEEFAILLSDTLLAGARSVAEDIRKRIASAHYKLRGEGGVETRVTVSVGLAAYRRGETRESFFHRCDQALYMAKERGRNQVVQVV